MRHRPSRWRWGSEEGDFEDDRDIFGMYIHAEKQVYLHPKLRRTRQHDELWTTLGHEFVHMIYKDNGSTAWNERRAFRLEEAAGQALHDFYHRFRRTGLPRCTGEKCRVKE